MREGNEVLPTRRDEEKRFLSNREGKTSSTSGIDTGGEARGTIPEGNEVLQKRRDEEHRFHLLRLRYYGSATQKQVTNTEIPCFHMFFNIFLREQ